MPEPGSTLCLYLASVPGDMDGERAVIAGLVLPELRSRAQTLGFALELVDPAKAKGEDWHLARRFREIDACRPFFLGLLGERYGDPPLAVPRALVAAHPWLAEDPGRSTLELEILYAAPRHPAEAAGAFFYLRDPRFPARVPDQHRARFLPESERAAARLAGLKERIRGSGRPAFDGYPCDWSGSLGRASQLDALAERILEDLWPAIQERAGRPAAEPRFGHLPPEKPLPVHEDIQPVTAPLPPPPPPMRSPVLPASAPVARRGGGFKAAAVLALAVLGLSLFLLRGRFGTRESETAPSPLPSQPPTALQPADSTPSADYETYDPASWRELTGACELSREEIARLPSREVPGANLIEVFSSPSAYNARVVQRQLESVGAFVLPLRENGKAACAVVLDPWEPAVQDYLKQLRARGTEPRDVLFPRVPG